MSILSVILPERFLCAGLEVEFDSTEELGVRELKLDREFDVVTCMFAIHYFFASSQALDCFLHNVVINLKEGEPFWWWTFHRFSAAASHCSA